MALDTRKFSVIILKCLFILASVSILFSLYWLRPLTNEGSRYTMTFIQTMSPYWDQINFRFLLVPFQLPALIAMKTFPEVAPLTVARLYFFSIYIPVIIFLGYLILRLKEHREMFIAAILFFVVILPGMNFQLSHITETLTIFIAALFCITRRKLFWFSLLLFAAILGHPAILAPLGVLFFLLTLETYYFKRTEFKRYLIVAGILITLLLLKTILTLLIFPGLSGNYLGTYLTHFRNISSSRYDFITAGYLLILSLFIDHLLKVRLVPKIAWIISSLLVIFFISRENSSELYHLSYQYRVFTSTFFCVLMIYVWMHYRLKLRPLSSFYPYAFMILLASWFTVREIKSAVWFWKDAPQLARSATGKGCQYTEESASFIHSSLPFLAIFHSNKRNVDSVLYSLQYDPDKKLCGAFRNDGFPYQIDPGGKIHRFIMPANGFFSITPMINQPAEGR